MALFCRFAVPPIALAAVMPAHSRSKNGVASLAYVAGIHAFTQQDVDGRDRPGHDEVMWPRSIRSDRRKAPIVLVRVNELMHA
jgi:hypothetical protein